jgi:hypothetical protein
MSYIDWSKQGAIVDERAAPEQPHAVETVAQGRDTRAHVARIHWSTRCVVR